jgi:Ethylbenzene dehydrogenase
MKPFKSKYWWVIATLVLAVGYVVSCTKDDQVLDTPQVINSSTDLVTVKTTAAPTIDGAIDAMWANSPKLQFGTAVPEVTGDVFRGYTGNIIPSVTLRSAYDATSIYFLAEWSDPTQSLARQPWYYDPATQRWAQESGNPTFSATGAITRLPFYEDKLALLWNVNNSVSGWNNSTCYKSCHTGLPLTDGASKHFTNFPTEKIDMWHWKTVRGGVNGNFQFDDQYQDNTYPNGRKSDAGTQAYSDNKQTLTITGTATSVSVPKYVIPGRTNYYWILGSEITAGTAKTVAAVSATGVLTLSDATTIDPNVGTEYQRVGAGLGPKAIAGINITAYDGSRGDITCKSTYTGTGWILEFQRALKTTDAVYDVDFSSLADQYFGFAIFENAQIAHSIKPNLILKFKK